MFELVLVDGDSAGHPLGAQPLYVGRAVTNGLVINDDTVSGRHAAVWASGDRAWVEDLKSRNGTFVNDRRVHGVSPLRLGDELRIGTRVRLRLRPAVGRREGALRILEDLATGLRYPLHGPVFRIGPSARADLRLDCEEAVIFRDPSGDLLLGQADDTAPLALDQRFEIGGRAFRVDLAAERLTVTRDAAAEVDRYRLRATLDGPTGPEAAVEDPEAGRSYLVTADNRAVLLYLLARQHADDAAAGRAEEERGWCADEQVVSGIWGRIEASGMPNNLNVLLARTRSELRKAGFDPWFIEKRRRYVRARVERAEVA